MTIKSYFAYGLCFAFIAVELFSTFQTPIAAPQEQNDSPQIKVDQEEYTYVIQYNSMPKIEFKEENISAQTQNVSTPSPTATPDDGIRCSMLCTTNSTCTCFLYKENTTYKDYGRYGDWVKNGLILPTTDFEQKKLVQPLVDTIKKFSNDSREQVKIAVNIIQNIPYDWDSFNNKTNPDDPHEFDFKNRYPYEVLVDKTGVCSEKARLLALVLGELGYGSAVIDVPDMYHVVAGIKCSDKESYEYSGYCLIETTAIKNIGDTNVDVDIFAYRTYDGKEWDLDG
jgi:hypothetical protein